MEAIEREHSDGIRWLLGAGFAAVLVTAFVAWADTTLSNSTREKDLGRTLLELRTSQASIPSGAVDPRQGGHPVLREPAVPAVLAAGRTQSHHDAHSAGH